MDRVTWNYQRFCVRFAEAYLLFSAALIAVYAVRNMRIQSMWAQGDWLINYAGGFVRRGFMGQLILQVARVAHTSPFPVTAFMHCACFALVLVAMYRLTLRTDWSVWKVAFLCSPATLAFEWLCPAVALRKEILLYALLGGLILLLLSENARDSVIVTYLCITVPVLMLSHEGMVCYLPYVFAPLLLRYRTVARSARVAWLPAALGAGSVLTAIMHSGTQQMAHQICMAVTHTQQESFTGVCGGAIAYIGIGSDRYRAEVIALLHNTVFIRIFTVTTLLSILPFLMLMAQHRKLDSFRFGCNILLCAFGASGIASLLLFVTAQDWGRWVAIHVTCLLLLSLFALLPAAGESAVQREIRPQAYQSVLLILYVAGWSLPSLGASTLGGYTSLVSRALHSQGLLQ